MSDELSHYGIKGMKWGVRRERSRSLASARKSATSKQDYETQKTKINAAAERKHKKLSRASNDRIRYDSYERRAGYGSVRTLSDRELKALNNRLDMEKKYRDMHPNTVKRGQNTVKSVIAVGATVTTLYNFANSPVGKKIGSAVKTAIKKSATKSG